MRKPMPDKSILSKCILSLFVVVGVFPLAYFLTVETGVALAASSDTEDTEGVDEFESFDRYVENESFGVGEKLTFDINYGFVNAGTATMEVQRLIEYQSRPAYQIVTRANSNRFFTPFYKVDDRIESIMDAVGLFSWRFDKRLHEGSYKKHKQYSFDQRSNLVYYENDTLSVPAFVQDAISTLYYIRTQPLKVGQSFFVDNFIDGKQMRLEVKVTRREKISVAAGTFECLKVEPMTETVGVFENSGALTVWLTDDRVKMPVLMKSKIKVGSITAELTDYKLGELSDI